MIRNSVTFIGNAGDNAALRQAGEKDVASVSVALSNGRDKEPTWIRAEAWGQLAERLATVKKGERIGGQGRLSVETYTDKEGKERTSVKIVLNDLIYLSPKQGEAEIEAPAGADEPF